MNVEEFPQLNDTIYFDYAASMPVCKSQVKSYDVFRDECVRNPHSGAKTSRTFSEVEMLRSMILISTGALPEDYIVSFTHNTTDSIQKIGSLLKIDNNYEFSYLVDNHNSILGLAEMMRQRGLKVNYVNEVPKNENGEKHIFAFPLYSNFNGKHYPLEWVEEHQKNGGIVILDAASSMMPDLSKYKPDFVVMSLLKLTGSHGGILLVRRDRIQLLNDPPPSGGNLLFSCARNGKFKLMSSIVKKLEGGTISYIDLLLGLSGMRVRRAFGSEKEILNHAYSVAKYFKDCALNIKHDNGKPLFKFYSDNLENDTTIHSFNLLDNDGKIINHQDLQFVFDVNKISVRIGSHCNPGATFSSLGWNEDEVLEFSSSQKQGEKCVSALCVVDGKAVGTIRASFGYPSKTQDVDRFISLVKKHFLNGGPNPTSEPIKLPFVIDRMFVFPIVGARGYEVKSSKVDVHGFEYDRRWRFVSESGEFVTPPSCYSVATIIAIIEDSNLVIKYNDKQIKVKINDFEEYDNPPDAVKQYGKVYSKEVSSFLSDNLGRYVYLVKLNESNLGKFAFSAITKESLEIFPPDYDIDRFYSNLLLKGQPAFSEEGNVLQKLKVGNVPITLWRWRVLCMTSSVVPVQEIVETDGMKKLVEHRSRNGATPFGVLFGVDANKDSFISVGDSISYL